ncbi:hypothetical protein H0H87_002159 [Tephrocybe sp. NHM501043]|nr:hypothetical protein H0H87_002159 [Tephrocybe sp. NHM501043]
MGFLKRIFSIGNKKNKKERPQIVHNVDARLRAIEEEEHEAAVGRLLRSSSTRYTVVSEAEYSSLPPLPHPINHVIQANNPNAIRTPGASTASIASSTLSRHGTYNVTVHKRKQHILAELQSATYPDDVAPSGRTPDAPQPELSLQLLELRSHPSVASLLDMYDEQGRIPDQAFSNSPPTPEHKERAQTRRNGSTLRQLLGEPASMNSRKDNSAGSAEGDISWAERFLGEVDSVSSTTSSVDLPTPSIHNAPFDKQNTIHNISLATDHDFFVNTNENSAISSMEVEVSLGDSLPSVEMRSAAGSYKSPDTMIPQRASQIFHFLTERRRPTYINDHERSLPELPSTFSDSSNEGSQNQSSNGHSHSSDHSFDATTQTHSAVHLSNTPISRPNHNIPQFTLAAAGNNPSHTVIDTTAVKTTPINATKTVWVASNAGKRDGDTDAPTRVIITAPTPSGKTGTPSRIPRGPRVQYRNSSSSSTKVRRPATLAERANSAAPRTQRARPYDQFAHLPSKTGHRRTPRSSSSSARSRDIEIGPPTRLSGRGSGTRAILSELDKENDNELTVKCTLPSTPIRSKSDSKSLFRGTITPSLFHPPHISPDLSSDLSPVGKEVMMSVRQKHSRARNVERQRSDANGGRFGFTAPRA